MASSLRGVGELVAYLPYELGFVPQDSLAVIALRDGHITITARFDRPHSADAADRARHVATSFRRSGGDRVPDDVVVLCYGSFGAADRLFVHELRSLLAESAVLLSHVGLVREGIEGGGTEDGGTEWRADRCSCGGCPREWVQVPAPTGVAAVADRVLQGVVPTESRAELGHRLQLRHPLVARAVEARIADGEPIRLDTAQALPRVLLEEHTPVHALPVDVLAAATLAVEPVLVRDQVLSWLMPDFLPAESTPPGAPIDPHQLGLPPQWLRDLDSFDDPVVRVTDRLEAWVRCIPVSRSVPVLLLVAGIRWTSGNGVLASMAADQALAIDPFCKLAVLFAAALRSGLRPTPHARPVDPRGPGP